MIEQLTTLNARRKALRMPVEALVNRSGVPRPTVFRILRGDVERVRFGHVEKVARVLGIGFGQPPADPEEMRLDEARRRARLIARITQGTMGLEAQAVSSKALRALENEAVAKLLADSGRKLWG